MADYWVSQGRKFCTICKCWFTDNQASIDFHERGKNHQQNVKKNLQDARKRATLKDKEKENLQKTLSSIEHAALSAYQKDLSEMLGLPVDGDSSKASSIPIVTHTEEREAQLQQLQQIQQFITLHQQREEKKQLEEFVVSQKKKIASEMGYQPSSLDLPSSSEPAPPPPPSQWVESTSPEGHTYYYNILTGVSQWEVPEELRPSVDAGNTAEESPSNLRKRPVDGDKEEDHDKFAQESSLQPKRRATPYGAWQTVAIRSQEEEEEEEEKEWEEGDEGETQENKCQGQLSSDESSGDEKVSFAEKAVALPEDTQVAPGSFKGFSFKKKETARPPIKQRTLKW